MAPKRLPEDPPPAASSTEEEEESEDDAAEEVENGVSEGVEDEEEDGDEEEDDHQNKKPATNKSTVTASLKASGRQSSSDSSDESESETDSESDNSQPSPSASDFTIKPIMSKPMKDLEKPQKRAVKRKLPMALTATVPGGKKRTSENDIDGKELKKNKLSNGQEEDLKRGSGVQRGWNEEDDIAILEGMLEYQSKKGADPCAEPAKSCSNSTFLEGLLVPGKLLSQPEAPTNIMKEALPMIGSTKAKEIESKWRKLQEDECQLYLKKIELVHESAKLLLEAVKSSKF